jgi:hypothetical protein
MGYERYSRDPNSGDYYGRPNSNDYGRDFKSTGDANRNYSSARDYAAADEDSGYRGQRDQESYYGRQPQGDRYGQPQGDRYGQPPRYNREPSRDTGRATEYHGAYAHDGRPFTDVGRSRDADNDYRGSGRARGYGRPSQGYDHDDRGFIARAGDEVRSWFGDDEAERRREQDARYDERSDRGSNDRDDHYHHWRSSQIAALDRDYDEYRQENRSKFGNEFGAWRTVREGQRSSLSKVEEHMEVVGSDGAHVGTVDKVRGDRILLTKNDKDAGGVHHSIPSRWIEQVDTKVTLSKSADDAKAAWKEEERNSASTNYGDRTGADRTGRDTDSDLTKGRTLDKSFSGTY